MIYDINPYKSVGNFSFGDNIDRVKAILGPPDSTRMHRDDEVTLHYNYIQLTFRNGKLVEAGFSSNAEVSIFGHEPFNSPDDWKALCAFDGAPKLIDGFLVLMKIGITLTGFHDNDESQIALTAFIEGRWDAYLTEMSDYKI